MDEREKIYEKSLRMLKGANRGNFDAVRRWVLLAVARMGHCDESKTLINEFNYLSKNVGYWVGFDEALSAMMGGRVAPVEVEVRSCRRTMNM